MFLKCLFIDLIKRKEKERDKERERERDQFAVPHIYAFIWLLLDPGTNLYTTLLYQDYALNNRAPGPGPFHNLSIVIF